MLYLDEKYKRANLLTKLCACTQWLLFFIFVHSVFLGGFNHNYIVKQKKEINHQEVFEDEESDKKSDEKSEVEAELEELFPEIEFELPSESAIDNPEGNTLEEENISQWYFITSHCL